VSLSLAFTIALLTHSQSHVQIANKSQLDGLLDEAAYAAHLKTL